MKKNKKIISIILTSFIILSIVVSSLVPTFSSYAVENEGLELTGSLVDYYSLPSSIMSNTDLEHNFNFLFKNQYFDNINGFYVNNKSNFNAPTGFLDYGSYICFYNNGFVFGSFPSDSFIICNDSTWRLYVDADFIKSKGTTYQFYYQFNDNLVYTNKVSSNFYAPTSTGVSIDDGYYYYEGRTTNFIFCDIPMYYSDNLQPSTLEGLTNFNPNYLESSHEMTASNNLYLNEPDFIFKNSDYYAPYSSVINTGNIYPSGDIRFTFSPNSYQKSHTEEFTVTLGFSFDYDVNYLLNGNSDNPPFYHKGLSNKKKNCSLRFIYSNNNSEYIDIPLSTFDANGDIYSISFEEVMSHMSGGGYNLSTVLQLSKELDSVEYNKFNINCTAFISADSESSGFYTEWYNPINKKGYTTDKSAEVNKNPYYSDNSDSNDVDDSTPLYTPGTAGTGGDNANNVGGGSNNNSVTVGGSSSSTGAINITNNNTAYGGSSSSIASGDGSSGFGSFLSTLITLLADGQSSSSETLAEISDSNGWMTVANTSLSAVPTSLWTTLLTTFTVCIAISVVACVISLLLKIFF